MSRFTQPYQWLFILLPIALFAYLTTIVVAIDESRSSTIQISPNIDTYIAEGQPDDSKALNTSIWVGHNETNGFLTERSLLKFDISNIPAGSTIQSATLSLYLAGTTTNDAPMNIQVSRLSGNWTHDITWRQYVDRINNQMLQVDSTTSVTTQLPAVEGWYDWSILAILQSGSNTGTRELSLIVTSDQSTGQHERGFWSKDCDPNICGGNQPKLEIVYAEPTATPRPTSTSTPTPTHTLAPTATAMPTPTAGILLSLQAQPANELQLGDVLLYRIEYRNSTHPLSNVRIEAPIPTDVEFIEGSQGENGGRVGQNIIWTLNELTANEQGVVSYSVQRPLPTATFIPTALPTNTPRPTSTNTPRPTEVPTEMPTLTSSPTPSPAPSLTPSPTPSPTPLPTPSPTPMIHPFDVSKVGPSQVSIGDLITYTLSIKNISPESFTSLLVTDTLPAGATFMNATDGGKLILDEVWWTIELSPNELKNVNFSVTAEQTIINSHYRVSEVGGGTRFADGRNVVVTEINSPTPRRTEEGPFIVLNSGARAIWSRQNEVTGAMETGTSTSNSVRNPALQMFLPLIQ